LQKPSLLARNYGADDAPTAEFADESAIHEAPTGQPHSSGESLEQNTHTRLTDSITAQSGGHSSSQQIAARRRLALLIAKEAATLSEAEEVLDSATSDAGRLLPAEEPNSFPPGVLKEAGSPSYPPAPPLPSEVSDAELSGEESSALESATSTDSATVNDSATTNSAPSKLDQGPEPNALVVEPSAQAVQPVPTAGVGVSLGGDAPLPLSPVSGNQRRQGAVRIPQPPTAQNDARQSSPTADPPGRVLLRRHRPGPVNQFFYGW
jgi:hypothetical protein